jgi:signal transduction histidine kinase/CheY-like chemotaxis protein
VLLLHLGAGVTWLLLAWRPAIGRWFTVLAPIVYIYLASVCLRVPELQNLHVVAVALAATQGGSAAAIAAALTASLFLLGPALPGRAAAVNLAAVWAVCALLWAADRRLQHVVQWACGYFERAQDLVDETRDRKVALEQALADLAHANRQLALANERSATLRLIAEEAQRSKAEFVARVSHEFRTPLNMIIGLVGLMVENPEIYAEELPPELWRDLEIVHRNCEHLASMVNDVLDLSRVEAGRLTLHREPTDLRELVQSVIEVVQPLAQKKQLELKALLPGGLPAVYCDRTRIRQVLLNLVSNAARFTPSGGITVRVIYDEPRVLIDVADTGPGISPQDAERIFEPFWQAPTGSRRERDGSGLGLSISKQLVELHGGRIWVESQVGVGTVFHVELPADEQPEPIRRPAQWIREDWPWREAAFRGARAAATEQLTRPRVIVWDATASLSAEWTRYGDLAEFVEARDLPETLRLLAECPAHAVVLNAATVGEVLAHADAVRRESRSTPIVGAVLVPPVARAQEVGALGHLVKPVTHADIARALRAAGRPVRRVLVVDDDPEVCRLLARMLHTSDQTIEVQAVSSGREALAQMVRLQPDLALLDIVLPDITGWEVLEEMHRDERLSEVPVFMVSAQDPVDQPPVSSYLLATMEEGLTVGLWLNCALGLSSLLLSPAGRRDRVPAAGPGA